MSIHKSYFIVGILVIAVVAHAEDAVWNVGGEGDWNDDANWLLSDGTGAVPDAGFDDAPVISNGGTAFLEEPALGNNDPFSSVVVGGNLGGGLEIRDGGELTTTTLSIEGSGSLSLGGASSLTVVENANTVGTTRISGSAVNYSVGGSYTVGGIFEAVISDESHSPVNVGGAANISASLRPAFDGVTPKLGDSWSLIDAGSVVGNFSEIDTLGLPALEAGVVYATAVNSAEGNVDLVVTNTLDLVVDRRTGSTALRNIVGDAISLDNYTISSPSGRLNSADGAWLSFADSNGAGGGWTEAPSDAQSLNESRAGGPTSIAVGSPIDLGTPVVPANFAPEDIKLTFSSEGVTFPGIVTYEGIPFTLVLSVDPDTGTAEITNQATVPIEFDGYAVQSESGMLKPAEGGWTSLADSGSGGGGWQEANPTVNAVAELNPASTTVLAPNESLNLGSLFDTSGNQDLSFSFFRAGGTPDLREGFVAYGFQAETCAPINSLLGDLDGNGTVAFPDFLRLSANFGASGVGYAAGDIDCNGSVAFPDFLTLSANFGRSLGATAATSAVPEPSSLWLVGLAGLLCHYFFRRQA